MGICTKKKSAGRARPGPLADPSDPGASRGNRDDFSFGGHRLPSLYRKGDTGGSGLTIRSSAWGKYPTGQMRVRGREAPTGRDRVAA
jgi:hypothetical protein